MSASGDGSESVDDFLARIASVKEARDEAGELELRRKEEEILKNRKERQARRAERARSLSPSKTGPAQIISTTITSSQRDQAINPPVDFSPSAKLSRANAVSGRISPSKDLDGLSSSPRQSTSPERELTPSQIQNNAPGLSRSGTLSWQQRPASRDGSMLRQGLSATSTKTNSPSLHSSQQPPSEEPSRKDIAASLAQKDPTWFRQTQDRGLRSAAYRKNQVEDSPTQTMPSKTMQLPGMAQHREPSKSPTPEARTLRVASPAQARELADSDRYRRGNTPDIASLRKSMIVLSPQQQAPQDAFSNRPISMISSSNTDSSFGLDRSSSVISSDRPVSPTKGFGGFVESAMMKRSDSVKRWSVKADAGLRRGDSVLGNRPPASLHSRGLSKDIHIARDASPSSPLASSRPGSGQIQTSSPELGFESPTNRARNGKDAPLSSMATDNSASNGTDIPDRLPARSQTPQDDSSLARSPSKTMDPRRWSPTKSTWLESALQSKAEPPKLQPLREDQPKWKVDLQRSRSRASRDVSPKKTKEQDENKLDESNMFSMTEESVKVAKEPANVSDTAVIRSTSLKDAKQRPASGSKPDHLKLPKTQSSLPSGTSIKEPVDTKSTLIEPKPTANTEVQKDEVKEGAAAAVDERRLPVLKPKPQTPPKTDFRATLKSRAPSTTSSKDNEPEFKAVFGKLKRTTTQNYVAPDELKTNILSGKAALSITAGPQKSKQIDPFKESILAKKDEIKTTSAKLGQNVEISSKPAPPLPEALARRKTLSKASAPNLRSIVPAPAVASKPELRSVGVERDSGSIADSVKTQPDLLVPSNSKETDASVSKLDPVSRPLPPKHSQPPAKPARPSVLERSQSEGVTDRQQETVSRPEVKRKTEPLPDNAKPVDSKVEPISSKPTSPDPPITNVSTLAGNKLASRLNPNLATMLSRSNSPKLPSNANTDSGSILQSHVLTKTRSTSQDDNPDSLTHMTKGRAKGPKRRAPKAEAPKAERTKPPATKLASPTLLRNVRSNESEAVDSTPAKPVTTAVTSLRSSDNHVKPISNTNHPPVASSNISPITITKVDTDDTKAEMSRAESLRQKPAIVDKSPELRRISGPLGVEQRQSVSPKSHPIPSPKPTPPLSSKPNLKEIIATPTKSPPAKQVMAIKSVSPKTVSKSAVTSEKSEKPKAAVPSSKPSNLQGLGLNVQSPPPPHRSITKPQILTPPIDSTSPSTVRADLQQIKDKIEGFVGTIDREQAKADFDAQQFLTAAKEGPAKVKRIRYTVHEITGDGKKIAMPPQQEHILYEEAMYLITHSFVNNAGATISEVYLWYGDRISDAAVEDVQLFCRKDAREHNTKLEVVKQGKESSNLIEALGGILITRRSKSSALYMLCGRRHLGQIVFDEVDMEPSNLCPGFVYLISAQFGKFYLWKGKGASADEIGSAKLIGMDLGLTGEIEEVEQGSESAEFWQSLKPGKPVQWSEDWHKRADGNGYPTMLYRIDHERPGVLGSLWALKRSASPAKSQSIKATCQKVEPFCQHDLETSAIYILDAYRSFYVLINNQSMSRGSELVTSMHLVQDLAMLSPSIQDRPLLPHCYVVIGEPTPDVKACFRKWSVIDGYSLGGKDSLVVPLEEAMEALGL